MAPSSPGRRSGSHRLLVLPVVDDRLQEVRVAACRDGSEEAAGNDLAAVDDARCAQVGSAPMTTCAWSKRIPRVPGCAASTRREQRAVAASDVDDRPEAPEVVCGENGIVRRRGERLHRLVEDRALLGVLGAPVEDISPVQRRNEFSPLRTAFARLPQERQTSVAADEPHPAAQRARHVAAERLSERASARNGSRRPRGGRRGSPAHGGAGQRSPDRLRSLARGRRKSARQSARRSGIAELDRGVDGLRRRGIRDEACEIVAHATGSRASGAKSSGQCCIAPRTGNGDACPRPQIDVFSIARSHSSTFSRVIAASPCWSSSADVMQRAVADPARRALLARLLGEEAHRLGEQAQRRVRRGEHLHCGRARAGAVLAQAVARERRVERSRRQDPARGATRDDRADLVRRSRRRTPSTSSRVVTPFGAS